MWMNANVRGTKRNPIVMIIWQLNENIIAVIARKSVGF